jgi:hypothetical protein
MLFAPVLLVVGIYLVNESIVRLEWYMDFYLFVGAIFATIGFLNIMKPFQRGYSIKRS